MFIDSSTYISTFKNMYPFFQSNTYGTSHQEPLSFNNDFKLKKNKSS